MTNSPVLVLNQNYQPLNICRARRAVVMIWRGKAEVVENNSDVMRSACIDIPVPSVIRLVYLIRRPPIRLKLSRREVFLRDRFTCQYCSKQTRDLTIDHVIPRRLGGEHSWENVVSACRACNQKKAGRSPQEASMRLLRPPAAPRPVMYSFRRDGFHNHPEWLKYVPNDNSGQLDSKV
jgi:5-methylcytosine-specific restriction endonuclease McrA